MRSFSRSVTLAIEQSAPRALYAKAIVLFAITITFSPASQGNPPAFVQLLHRLAAEDRFSGVVLVRSRQHQNLVPLGVANAEFNVPMHEDVRFQVYSVAKVVTATAVLRSQELGRIGLTDSICGHINPCPSSWKPITIHQLLSHRSGIPSYRQTFAEAWTGSMQHSFRVIAPELVSKPLAFEPGTDYAYSNWGYVLLALVLENVWDAPFSDVLKRLVFEPANMSASHLARAPEAQDFELPFASRTERESLQEDLRRKAGPVVEPLVASGYDGNPAKLIHSGTVGYTNLGAGGLRSTARDMSKFMESLFDEALLTPNSLALMTTPPSDASSYALGIRSADSDAGQAFSHTGGINGFVSYVGYYPERQASVVILANFGFSPLRMILSEIETYLADLPNHESTSYGVATDRTDALSVAP